MTERKIDYRGSKSIIAVCPIHTFAIIVKEQRVDGSSWEKPKNIATPSASKSFSHVRCTLTGFERKGPPATSQGFAPSGMFMRQPNRSLINYQVRILSNQINKLKKYTNIAVSKPLLHTGPFNPWFVTGFCDAESSFYIGIIKSQKLKLGRYVLPSFQINIHKKDLALLESLKLFWGVGKIYIQKESCSYFVNSIEELLVIIKHFDNYPLVTKKNIDFKLFKRVIYIIYSKKHLIISGLEEIVAIKTSMNWGISEELKTALPNIIAVDRPVSTGDVIIPDPHWLVGFTEGEGCFSIIINESSTIKTGFQIQLRFKLTQHIKDEKLMKS